MDTATLSPGQARHVLRLMRQVMPGVAGVVLATPDGVPLAHDVGHGNDARRLAAHAAADAAPGASTLVPWTDGLVLVVLLPAAEVRTWQSGGAVPVPA